METVEPDRNRDLWSVTILVVISLKTLLPASIVFKKLLILQSEEKSNIPYNGSFLAQLLFLRVFQNLLGLAVFMDFLHFAL